MTKSFLASVLLEYGDNGFLDESQNFQESGKVQGCTIYPDSHCNGCVESFQMDRFLVAQNLQKDHQDNVDEEYLKQ